MTGTLLLRGAGHTVWKNDAHSAVLVTALSTTLTLCKELEKIEEHMPHS